VDGSNPPVFLKLASKWGPRRELPPSYAFQTGL
jgi:hypothetical protein